MSFKWYLCRKQWKWKRVKEASTVTMEGVMIPGPREVGDTVEGREGERVTVGAGRGKDMRNIIEAEQKRQASAEEDEGEEEKEGGEDGEERYALDLSVVVAFS